MKHINMFYFNVNLLRDCIHEFYELFAFIIAKLHV